jgi:hypothetical protein
MIHMTQPIIESDTVLSVHRSALVLRDADCDAWSHDDPVSSGDVVTGYLYGVELRTRSAEPRMEFRVWDTDPHEVDGWDGSGEFELHCPTGRFLVATLFIEPGIDVPLPAGPGVYGVRVAWRDRERGRATEDAVFGAHRGSDEATLSAALDEVRGIERYRVDLWRQADLPPDDEDED